MSCGHPPRPIGTRAPRSEAKRREPSARGLWAAGGLTLDELDRVAQARKRLGLDRVGLEIRPEALHDVGHQAQEDARIGDEELRLVVVANEREPALQDPPILDVSDLRREVVALDAV